MNSNTARPVVTIGALTLRFIADENTGAGGMVMFEFEVPPKARVPALHFHRAVDEVIYGLSGIMTTRIDGAAHEIGPGQSASIPRGAVHIHENLHEETARALIVMTPASIGRAYFEELAQELNGPAKPDMARVKAIMDRHGLTVVGQ
jgi:quercetin dioxygenase-like cupin family protein